MDGPAKDVLARMPLAEAVLLLWRWTTDSERLQRIWDEHRGRCYQKIITFQLIVALIGDALLGRESGRFVLENAVESGQMEASIQAAYRKLGRLPVEVSQAFLLESTAALRQAFPEWATWQGPRSLTGLRVIVLDGKAIKKATRRLKALRGVPGSLMVGFDQHVVAPDAAMNIQCPTRNFE